MNSITDVGGIRVGHYHRLDPDASLGAGWACGVTVVLTPPGTVGGVDCRGGAPGTRETDLLDPANTVRFVDAVLLAGGSAYGLAAADGVMRWLEEHERGVGMDGGVGALRAGAVIFALPGGRLDLPADGGIRLCGLRSCRRRRRPSDGRRDRRRRGGRAGRGAQGWHRDSVDGTAVRRHRRRGRRGGRRGCRRRPGHRSPLDGGPDRRVRAYATAGRADRRVRAVAVPLEPAEYHD